MSEGDNKWDTTAYNNHFSLMLRIRRRGDNINCMISQPRFASIHLSNATNASWEDENKEWRCMAIVCRSATCRNLS